MKININTKLINNTISVLLILSCSILSCSKKTKKDDKHGTNNSNNSSAIMEIEKKYLREGFISNNKYRVVIVSTKEESLSDIEGIKSKGEKRALITLRTFLISKNRKYDKNVRAEILNLINQNGRVTKKKIGHNRNDIYYFDINKRNIKKYLNNISSPR